MQGLAGQGFGQRGLGGHGLEQLGTEAQGGRTSQQRSSLQQHPVKAKITIIQIARKEFALFTANHSSLFSSEDLEIRPEE